MTWDEYRQIPWHEQGIVMEGLIRAELYNPDDYGGGDVDEDLDSLASSGFQVGVEYQ
jgi:hypothetical protein